MDTVAPTCPSVFLLLWYLQASLPPQWLEMWRFSSPVQLSACLLAQFKWWWRKQWFLLLPSPCSTSISREWQQFLILLTSIPSTTSIPSLGTVPEPAPGFMGLAGSFLLTSVLEGIEISWTFRVFCKRGESFSSFRRIVLHSTWPRSADLITCRLVCVEN